MMRSGYEAVVLARALPSVNSRIPFGVSSLRSGDWQTHLPQLSSRAPKLTALRGCQEGILFRNSCREAVRCGER